MTQLLILILVLVTFPVVALFGLIARAIDKWSKDWGKL